MKECKLCICINCRKLHCRRYAVPVVYMRCIECLLHYDNMVVPVTACADYCAQHQVQQSKQIVHVQQVTADDKLDQLARILKDLMDKYTL